MAMDEDRAAAGRDPLVFLHVGDLHLTCEDDRSAQDLRAILAQIAGLGAASGFDFVYLPGDLAEDGCEAQYGVLRRALEAHPDLPVRLIPGDHDRQHDTMDDFNAFVGSVRVNPKPPRVHQIEQPPVGCPGTWIPIPVTQHYFAERHRGVRCLFLDIVSAGFGRKGVGLDFRLGREQTQWLAAKLTKSARKGEPCAVFMHAYPDDLREPDDRFDIAGLFWASGVRLVEMGHTHYNELGHDGRTLYAAARSVGQNEDGSVGYAVAAIDGGVTSWRFKALDRDAPFVLITSPSDRRVARDPPTPRSCGMPIDDEGRVLVRAVVLSARPLDYVHCRVDTGPWTVMTRPPGARCHEAWLPWRGDGRTIQVEAVDVDWSGHGPDHIDTDVIEPVRTFAEPGRPPRPMPGKPGSDAFRIAAWPQKGVRGDQMGPNRGGRKW